MIRGFIKNVSLLVLVNVLVKVVYVLGIEVGVQNHLGEADYGLYFTLLNFVWLFQIISDFGLQNFTNSHVAAHPVLAQKYFPQILTLKALLSLAFAGIVLLAGCLLGYTQSHPKILGLLVLNQVLMSLIIYLRSNVTALGYFRQESIFSVLDKVLMICLLAPLLYGVVDGWTLRLDLGTFVLIQTIALGMSVLVTGTFVVMRLGKLRWRWSPVFLRYLWRQSRWFALVVFLMMIYTRVDAVMIEQLHARGVEEAGIYAACYRLLDVSNMPAFLVASFLIPLFARHRKDTNLSRRLWVMSFRGLLVIYLGAVLVVLISASEILQLLYDGWTGYWTDVFVYLFPSCLAWVVMYSSGAWLTATERLKPQIALYIPGVLLNVVLNYYLIPVHGAQGAAMSTLATQLAMGAGIQWMAKKRLAPAMDLDSVKRWMLLMFLCVGLVLLASTLDYFWVYECLGAIIVYLVAVKILEIIDLQDWLQLKQRI